MVAGLLFAGLTMVGGAQAAESGRAAVGGAPFRHLMEDSIVVPSANPGMAQRQAVGCTLGGFGVAGIAITSGAMAAAGAAGAAMPVGVAMNELIAYFGAGCTIGAFLAGLFPPAPAPDTAMADIGG
ncbi:hypothetical protein TSO352_31110 [Azospirillum sp. TSO35-2]|nr:hypothetical protein TSO352_31110 [Azospirillum sp. TSO35-2]